MLGLFDTMWAGQEEAVDNHSMDLTLPVRPLDASFALLRFHLDDKIALFKFMIGWHYVALCQRQVPKTRLSHSQMWTGWWKWPLCLKGWVLIWTLLGFTTTVRHLPNAKRHNNNPVHSSMCDYVWPLSYRSALSRHGIPSDSETLSGQKTQRTHGTCIRAAST